jgi:hypothetical protein
MTKDMKYPDPGQISLTIVRTEDGNLQSRIAFNMDGVPDDELPFFHALREGLVLLGSDPQEIANEAVEARMEFNQLKNIYDTMYSNPKGQGEQVKPEEVDLENVVTFKGRPN